MDSKVREALEALLAENEDDAKAEAEARAKAEEEAKAKAEAKKAEESKNNVEVDVEALLERLQRLEDGNQGNPKEEEKNGEREKELETLNERLDKQVNKAVLSSITEEIVKKGLDAEYVDNISDYLAYDKLKKDGEVDTEAISNLAGFLSSIALRKPPKGSGRKTLAGAKDSGIGRYLDK